MKFLDFLKKHNVILDGGMGSLLQEKGLTPGELPERWNITHPDIITEIHKAYFDAGSDVVMTNTFGANSLKFSENELREVIKAAFENAKAARRALKSQENKFIALDVGPLGRLLAPYGDLDFEAATDVFAKTVRLGVEYGAELIVIETMNDSYEAKAALLAAKENSTLPVIVTCAFGEDKRLMTGATPSVMAAMLEGMGADAIGANCSLGPRALVPVMKELASACSVPTVCKPNAGLPHLKDGKTVYDVTPEDFAEELLALSALGVRALGGCCGTTPEYIRALKSATENLPTGEILPKNITSVTSYAKEVRFGARPVLIGERINPTGKKRFKEALLRNDMDYILGEGLSQENCGADALDVNVGMPEIDEADMLESTVRELQTVTALPLQIDTSDAVAMERAMRRYNGKPLINSVNGKRASMEKIFPLVKKYGGTVIALTLDENGIPESAEKRVEIAKKILAEAEKYGINKKDIIFDTLAMTVSAEPTAASVTLEALRRIKNELGCHTSLGVSNVSFGLPARDTVNAAFFTMALANGLSAAIINPHSEEIMKAYHTYNALSGNDPGCADYIKAAEGFSVAEKKTPEIKAVKNTEIEKESALGGAIRCGMRESAGNITRELLRERDALDIIENEIIPALNVVGEGYENKTVYLPELLMSAEAAKMAFEEIKSAMKNGAKATNPSATVVLATVKGDIHDIGKNIVKLLMENYGYSTVDLGKDVAPEKILDAVLKNDAAVLGLSALMTTTLAAMEETVKLVLKNAPSCKIMVGGAVLTEKYAEKIGAHKYAKDAMDGVRYVQQIIKN